MDSTDILWESAAADMFPHDPLCLHEFLFDRTAEPEYLLGLYQGIITYIPNYTQRDYKEEIRAAVREDRLISCIEEIYLAFHRETKYGGSGYWHWFLKNKAKLSRVPDRLKKKVQPGPIIKTPSNRSETTIPLNPIIKTLSSSFSADSEVPRSTEPVKLAHTVVDTNMRKYSNMDSTDILWDTALADTFPYDTLCLSQFLFDRTTDWSSLLGLYQGIITYIPHYTQRDYKEEIRAAVREDRLISCIEEIYLAFHRETKNKGSGYWDWFLKNKSLLARDVLGTNMRQYSKVLVTGNHLMKGSFGYILCEPKAESRAIPVSFSENHRFKIRRTHFRLIPATSAVIIVGSEIFPAYAPVNLGPVNAPKKFDWVPPEGQAISCLVPSRLGIPLALIELAPNSPRPPGENMATFLLVDPVTGLAPSFVQLKGFGPVLVARLDDLDFTMEEMHKLLRYLKHLMDLWSDAPPTAALNPTAYAAFGP